MAHALVLEVYRETKAFPSREAFGLTSQLRRGCVSVAANIAEGVGRESQRDFLRFLRLAFGSLREIEYLLQLAGELGYLLPGAARALGESQTAAARSLTGLMRRVEKDLLCAKPP